MLLPTTLLTTLMKQIGFYRSICLLILLLGYWLIVPMDHVSAQGQSLSIYPPIIEVQTTPPASPVVPIVVQNNNTDDVSLKIQLIPFKTNSVSGQVILEPELINSGFYPYYKDRIQFLVDGKKTDTLILQALESKEVELNINLTKGDPPGDYYFSVVFISDGTTQTGSSIVQIPTGIATNLLLSIGPKGQSAGGISQFSTSSFKSKGPVNFTLKIHNASKHLVLPSGSIEITNIFGHNVGSVKILPQYILAGSDRFLLDDQQSSPSGRLSFEEEDSQPKVNWPEKFLFGWYRATATIQLADDTNKLTATTYFFAFPLYFFFPLVVILFIAASIYLRVRKKL